MAGEVGRNFLAKENAAISKRVCETTEAFLDALRFKLGKPV